MTTTNTTIAAQTAERRLIMSFSTTTTGTLPAGTVTPQGTIERTSLTAYRMTSGEWVAFGRVHGPAAAAAPLVTFG